MSDDAAWRPDAPAATPVLELAGYSGFELVARGSESTVYRARQDLLGRDVAVKVLQVLDEATTARFQRELELTVELGRQHPNIVTVLDTGTLPTGEPCIVMAYHELGSLHDRLRQLGPLPVGEVVAAGTVVADALAFAHDRGVLHRDVKPQNILLLPTSYVLADFGIARLADAGHTASAERFSYRHASPQVLDGYPPAAADDVWSLGSTLYTLLDGRPPFASLDPDDDTALAYLRRVRTERPRPLRREDVPDELRSIVDRCLAVERSDRFPDAAAIRDALRAVPTELRRWAPDADDVLDGTPDTDDVADSDGVPRDAALTVASDTLSDTPPATSPATSPDAPPDTPRDAPAVAASALAHPEAQPRPTPGTDEDLTLGRPLLPPPPPPPSAPATEAARPDRRVWAFAAVALVVGIGLSIAIAFVGRGDPDPPPRTDIGAPLPELTDDLGADLADDDLQPTLDDAALSPELDLDDRGTAIALSWSDPTDGTAQFVVAQTTPDGAPPRQYPAGTTSATLEGLDPDAASYCFRVLAITPEGQGISEERCTRRG